MLPQIKSFVMNHWALVGGFVVVAIMLVVEEIRAQGPKKSRLTAAGVTQLINHEDAIVIDVRDAAAFREGHIVNAKNFPAVDFDRQIDKINRDRPIVLVDSMGEKMAGLIVKLNKAGFQKVFAMKNGMDGWKTSEMPIVKGQK